MVLGMVFIVSEGITPSFVILGIGGTVVFILDSILLMNMGYVPYRSMVSYLDYGIG